MRVLLFLTLLTVSPAVFSQSSQIFGIYQLDVGSPSKYYLELQCDSTFRFIIHYDFSALKSYFPELTNRAFWTLTTDSTLLMEKPYIDKKAIFKLTSNTQIMESRKKDNYLWIKIINYDSACRAIDYTHLGATDTKIVYRLIPNKQLINTEYYEGNVLKRRVTYFELSQQEIDSMLYYLNNFEKDPIIPVLMRVYGLDYQLPVLMEEEWKNNEYTVTQFNRQGERNN